MSRAGSRGEAVLVLFSTSAGPLRSLSSDPFLTSLNLLLSPSNLFLPSDLLYPLYKGPYDYIRPTRIRYLKIFKLMLSAKSLLLLKVKFTGFRD